MASVNENPNEENKGYFDMLPDVALIEILSYLHATEVSKVTSISRRLFDLALTRTAGRNVNLSGCRDNTWGWLLDYMKTLSGVMIGALDLSHNPWISAKYFEKLTNFMVNVTCLDVTGCCISEKCMDMILSKATKLHKLAYTDRNFTFISAPEEGSSHEGALSSESLCTLSGITHLSIAFLMCCVDLSLVAYCPKLTALRLDHHLKTTGYVHCGCSFQNLTGVEWEPGRMRTSMLWDEHVMVIAEHFHHLKQFSQTRAHSLMHPQLTYIMKNIIKHLLLNGASFTKLFFSRAISATENDQIFQSKLNDKPYWSSNLSHADMPFDLKRTVPSLRYLRTDLVCLKNVEDHTFKQFPNLQYLRLCQGTSEKMERLILELLPQVASACPNLLGLCLPGIHIHPTTLDTPVSQILGRMKKLQYLSISPCAFGIHSRTNHSIFDTKEDIAERASALPKGIENSQTPDDLGKDISGLVQSCPGLTELELINPQTRVSLGYPYDGISDSSIEGCRGTSKGMVPTDETLSVLGHLKYLQRLTLGGVSGIRHGAGFSTIFKECRQLSFLSLADFGLRGHCSWMPAFCDALKFATSLQDLRIDLKNLNVSIRLQSSLQHCKKLRRICLISENGRIEKPAPSHFMELVESCPDLYLLVLFTADSFPVRKNLGWYIKKGCKEIRPSLLVDFGSSEELKSVVSRMDRLSFVPNIEWGEFFYFKYHVCSPERHNGIT
ncbi:uncharacterized protein LOC115921162 [Strongylocentrotus purpuratus]|uniref:F-box domain-containing protein n=1 Tax=Strongylocentrotus purpuratus TaxID=7668 RepID=A0A7M7NFE4_STRPU|nr:uncharacterized protein LOC115921162 [Strongylocentrotus purpuratus]